MRRITATQLKVGLLILAGVMLIGRLSAPSAAHNSVAASIQTRASTLEAIVGPLGNRDTVRVKVNSAVANLPDPLPKPVSIQLARLYVYVMRDRLGESATLDATQHILVVTVTSRRLPTGDARQLLQASLTDALNRAADAQVAKGRDVLAHWYVEWAQWFGGLGIDLGAKPGSDSLSWALGQSSDVLKSELAKRLVRVIDKVSLTPINLP